MTPPIPAHVVAVAVGVEDDFRKRHGKNGARASAAWAGLVAKRSALQADIDFGPWFKPPKVPRFLKDLGALHVPKGLPHGFRAVYSVFKDPVDGLVVQIEWVGDHQEYDTLFGYATT